MKSVKQNGSKTVEYRNVLTALIVVSQYRVNREESVARGV